MGGIPPWCPVPWERRKFSELVHPQPTGVLTFIDSHPTTDTSAEFSQSVGEGGDAWGCLPGEQHNRGANLAVADGHVEHWRWRWGRSGGIYAVESSLEYPLANADDRYDFQRVKDHFPRP